MCSRDQWVELAGGDPDLLNDPGTLKCQNDVIEEISIELKAGDADEEDAGDVELDVNDPVILRLFRVSNECHIRGTKNRHGNGQCRSICCNKSV